MEPCSQYKAARPVHSQSITHSVQTPHWSIEQKLATCLDRGQIPLHSYCYEPYQMIDLHIVDGRPHEFCQAAGLRVRCNVGAEK